MDLLIGRHGIRKNGEFLKRMVNRWDKQLENGYMISEQITYMWILYNGHKTGGVQNRHLTINF